MLAQKICWLRIQFSTKRGGFKKYTSIFYSKNDDKNLSRFHVITCYAQVNQLPLSLILARRQLTWIGHILRESKDEKIGKICNLEA